MRGDAVQSGVGSESVHRMAREWGGSRMGSIGDGGQAQKASRGPTSNVQKK